MRITNKQTFTRIREMDTSAVVPAPISTSTPDQDDSRNSSPDYSKSLASSSSDLDHSMEALEIESSTTAVASDGNSTISSNSYAMNRCRTIVTSNSCMMYCFDSVLYRRTLADALLSEWIVQNGKLAPPALLLGLLVLIIVWAPLYLLAKYLVTEIGVYLFLVMIIFSIGRMIIRLIAFPGASVRVQTDIQKEFAKYTIRCIDKACQEFIELSNIMESKSSQIYELKLKWEKVDLYRCRLVAVLCAILTRLLGDDTSLNENQTSNDSNFDEYGNNLLVGDIGILPSTIREDSTQFLSILSAILSSLNKAKTSIEKMTETNKIGPIRFDENIEIITGELRRLSMELRDLLPSLVHSDGNEVDSDLLEGQGQSNLDMMKSSLSSIIPFVDPPPYNSPFSLDLIRGCVLSRYCNARQLWIERSGGGRIDCLHLPALGANRKKGVKRAIIYCNPNAGLCEMTSGVDFFGGSVGRGRGTIASEESCWADFYINRLGFDIFLFNYAGYGRSTGDKMSNRPAFLQRNRIIRILCNFVSFQPCPDSLKMDTVAVIRYVENNYQFENIIVHGESIGGMAGASAVSHLSTDVSCKSKISLLICDRTFCNLEAIAQRLVGGWTAPAIRFLTPFWKTDVAGNFIASTCPKIIATDSSDAIIADPSSLKSGVAVSIEMTGFSTKDACWIRQTPLYYRMAEYDGMGIEDFLRKNSYRTNLSMPQWPTNKHLTIEMAFRFAYCTRRIGKLATSAKRGHLDNKTLLGISNSIDSNEGFEVSKNDEESLFVSMHLSKKEITSTLIDLWYTLGCCDGLCGSSLGQAVKDGMDATVTWLCNTLVFGGQRVISAAEKRVQGKVESINSSDFDLNDDSIYVTEIHRLIPIPSVVSKFDSVLQQYCTNQSEGGKSDVFSIVLSWKI